MDEFEDILRSVRDFVRRRVVTAETEIDERDEIPTRLRDAARDMGLFGFALPEAYGGMGFSMEQEVRLVFELGYTTPAFRSLFGTNNGIAGQVLVLGATDEQRARWLPGIAAGEVIASFALTEAEAGSDPAALATVARREGHDWVLDGAKRYITNAPLADLLIVFARTSRGERPADGISAFLIPTDTPGITIGARDHKMGQAGAWTADVSLDGVRVGSDALVGGRDGDGYAAALRCLAHGRIHIAALCVGLAQRLVDETVAYAQSRRQSGRPIGEFQLVQGMIADSITDLYAGRGLVLEAARAFDAGTDRRTGPSCAKYFASEMVGRVADRAVQVHGGAGYMRGIAVERFYRDARLFRLYEGTSQIQQIIIAKQALREGGRSHA